MKIEMETVDSKEKMAGKKERTKKKTVTMHAHAEE